MRNRSVAIAVPGDLEQARTLLACGRRIAADLGVGWVAVRVSGKPSARIDGAAGALRELVAALGGALLSVEADDVAGALIDVSRRENAQLLVIGKSLRPRILRRVRRGTTERILEARRPFDVCVAGEGREP